MALFNPRTRDAMRRRKARQLRLVLAFSVVVIGAMIGGGHYEEPLLPYLFGMCAPDVARSDCQYSHWLDVAAGLAAAAAFGALGLLLYRLLPVRPTVSCRRCGSAGWIEDLQATAGGCPRCGHGRFRYRASAIVPEPDSMVGRYAHVETWALDDVAGTDLLALKAEKGASLN